MADTALYWGGDAPSTGAFQSHVVDELFKPAGFDAIFYQIADKKLLTSGEELTIPSYSNLDLPTSQNVAESNRLPTIKLSLASKVITPEDKGLKMEITDQMIRKSPVDVVMASKSELSRLMKRELERVCKNAADDTPIKYVATSATAQSIETDGSASGTIASNPNIYHIRRISTYMQDVLRAPFHKSFGGYVGVFRHSGVENIMNDDDFIAIHTSLPEEALRSVRVKKIADMSIIGYNDSGVLSGSLGASSNLSEGLIFGDEALKFVHLDLPQMYYDFSKVNANDFGRFNYIAWRGNFAAGLPSDSANAGLARVVHWTTA